MDARAKNKAGKWITILLITMLLTPVLVFGQNSWPSLTVGDQGRLKFNASAQIWARYTELNPGSTIQGEARDYATDVSIRRFRVSLSGYVTDRWFVKFQLGTNNLNYLSNNSDLRILDLEASYRFAKAFELGGGKNGYVGLSRYAAPANAGALGFDLAFFAMPTVGITDDILRKYSIYAKGEIGPVAYRAVVAKPLAVQSAPSLSEQATFQDLYTKEQYSAYIAYQFFDHESQKSAYRAATYHGKKKIMNIGAGFMYQPDALAGLKGTDTISYDMKHYALDFFMELPLTTSGSRAITLYAGYFDYNYGKDYLRLVGVNNPADGVENGGFNGAGNKFPATGTGQILYSEAGYLTDFRFAPKLPTVQPFASLQYANYDALDEHMIVYDYGINLLFNGHKSKLSIGVQNRPIYEQNPNERVEVCNRMNMWVMQYQIKF